VYPSRVALKTNPAMTSKTIAIRLNIGLDLIMTYLLG
jgi:hypothetical protein